MKLLLNYQLYLIIGILLLASCQKDTSQQKLLSQAHNRLSLGEADSALNILSSIHNPNQMDEDSYMRYIVTYVGAKYETKQDIKNDSLILKAQQYFNKKRNSEYTTLANYYAGQLYDENSNFPQALESYLIAAYSDNNTKDSFVVSKSLNNIGYIYYDQNLLDSAILYYKEALSYYDKVKQADQRQLKILTNIGRSFEEMNQLDSAYLYFDKSLSLAKEINNESYQFHSLQNLGVVCFGKQDYNKAIEYFESALAVDTAFTDQKQRINLYLLNIYNQNKDIKSAKQYADLTVSALPDVSYIYTREEMYSSLADYYTLTNDYKKALEYRDLEKSTRKQIEKESVAPALLVADKNFYLEQKDREVHSLVSKICFFLILGVVVLCAALILGFFVWKNNKKHKKEIAKCAEKYEILKGMLFSMRDEYPKIEAEIKSMLDED